MLVYQPVLDLASKVSGKTITDHRTAIQILLDISREVEDLRRKCNLTQGEDLVEHIKKMVKRRDELLAEKEKLLSASRE